MRKLRRRRKSVCENFRDCPQNLKRPQHLPPAEEEEED
jgi:hypothetical protein